MISQFTKYYVAIGLMKYQPTPAGGLGCPSSLCSNLLCESNVSMLSKILLHIQQIYDRCFVIDDDDCGSLLAVFDEDTDMLAGIITIIYNIIMTFMVNNNNI